MHYMLNMFAFINKLLYYCDSALMILLTIVSSDDTLVCAI